MNKESVCAACNATVRLGSRLCADCFQRLPREIQLNVIARTLTSVEDARIWLVTNPRKKTEGVMRKISILVVTLAALMTLASCKDADVQQMESMGSQHHITLYAADGKILGQWDSTGNISNEENSDGWYFKDAKSGKLIEVTGTLIIEQE